MRKKYDDVAICNICKDELIVGVNWAKSRKNKGHYICNKCVNKKIKDRKLNDPLFNEKQKEYYKKYNDNDERKKINSERQKEWKLNNIDWVKERDRISSLKRKYGITLEEYNKILEKQNFVCAICGTDTPTGVGTFHVDHCHKTGIIRGVLCSKGNHALGLFNDDEKILLEAYQYLVNKGVKYNEM